MQSVKASSVSFCRQSYCSGHSNCSSPVTTFTDVQELKPLTISGITAATPERRRYMPTCTWVRVFFAKNSRPAKKTTGMLLELDDPNVPHLLDTPDALKERLQEAEHVARAYTKSIAQ